MAKATLVKSFTARVNKFEVKTSAPTTDYPQGRKYIELNYTDNTIDPFEATDNDSKNKVLLVSSKAIELAEGLKAEGKNMPDRKVEKYRVTGLPSFVAKYQEDRVLKDGRAVKAGDPVTFPNGQYKVKTEMLIDIFTGGATQESAVDVATRIINDDKRFLIIGEVDPEEEGADA